MRQMELGLWLLKIIIMLEAAEWNRPSTPAPIHNVGLVERIEMMWLNKYHMANDEKV